MAGPTPTRPATPQAVAQPSPAGTGDCGHGGTGHRSEGPPTLRRGRTGKEASDQP